MGNKIDFDSGRKRMGRIALGDLFHRAARRFGDKTAIIDKRGPISFNKMNAEGNRFAHGLLQRGLLQGERVGMLCANSVEMIYAFSGIQKAGLVWVPINTGLMPEAIDQIVEHAEIGTLVVDGDLYERAGIRDIINRRGLRCIVINPSESFIEDALAIPFGASICDMPDDLPEVDIGTDDLVLIMYTSGTTGKQKGVMHSHGSVYAAVMSNIAEFGVVGQDVASCIFPLFHVAQHATSMTFWVAGAAIRLDSGFEVENILDGIERHRISVLVALPMMYGAILNAIRTQKRDLSSLRLCIYAMAPMSQTMLTSLISEVCPQFALCSGQTEMYSITTMFKPEEQLRRFGPYWGSSAYVNETHIMDDEGNLLERDQVGEIVHRGPNIMLGYYKDAEATKAARAYGWHHTGDLGKFDKDGQLLFVDRKKDMIKTGGENVPSLKVEEVMLRHAAVANVAVIGLPHPRWTEAVTAFVVLKPGSDASETDLLEHCRSLLGAFECPKRIVFVDSLPMTITGKILKASLRSRNLDVYEQ